MAAAGATILPRGGSAAARAAPRPRPPRGEEHVGRGRAAAGEDVDGRGGGGRRQLWRLEGGGRGPRGRGVPGRRAVAERRAPGAARDGLDDRRRDVSVGVVVRVPELRQRRGVERRRAGRPLFPRPLGHAAAAREAVRQVRDRRRRVRVDGRGQRPGQGRRAHYSEPLPRGLGHPRGQSGVGLLARDARRRVVVELRVARRLRRLRFHRFRRFLRRRRQLRLAFPNTPDQTDDVEPRRRRHGVVGADAVEDAPRQRVDIEAAAFRLLRPGVQGPRPLS